jgi:enoyl-CoA hydratase
MVAASGYGIDIQWAMAASPVLTVQHDDHVSTLWLDRPDARNALGPEFWTSLPQVMAELSEDPEVRAVVIAARGPHFSVGLDLKAMSAEGGVLAAGAGNDTETSVASRAGSLRATIQRMQGALSSVADCPKPVIAAVHGYCLGGGLDLAAACDIRLASLDAVFSIRETRVAIVADLGSLQRLPRIVGKGHVAELAFTGKDMPAARAREIGLVNEVYPTPEALIHAAGSLAAEIAGNSPLAVQGTKAVLAASEDRSVRDGLEYVAAWNAAFLQSEDLLEAMQAFWRKQPPTFRGR